MSRRRTLPSLLVLAFVAAAAPSGAAGSEAEDRNKETARSFYDDLWFHDRTDAYERYLADEYVIHDIGGIDGWTEPAVRQKEIADFFWSHGELSGTIDYQMAEGDLVATRWLFTFRPDTLFGRLLLGRFTIPIINVFRFENGQIVEIWNHRHDIDTGRTRLFVLRGLLIGLLIACVPTIWAWRLRRRLRARTG